MKEDLNNIILKEIGALEDLLKELEEQYKYILKNDVFAMEHCVETIGESNRAVAVLEMERRKLTGDTPVRLIVDELKDEELEKNFRKIKKLLEDIKVQKDSNELSLKQGISYTNKLLNIIKPTSNNVPNTYNANGKVKR